MKVTVCLRPFRFAGPRLEIERFGEKSVVHNYGHGGSGWSLSWGCASEAAALTMATGARDVAVVGAGVIGMTTALRLIEAGARVTVYAHEFPSETRSARATGVWSPASRIALGDVADAGFAQRWEGWARASYAAHLGSVGLGGAPVEFLPQYNLSGGVEPHADAAHSYFRTGGVLRDINPRWPRLEGEANPFPGHDVRSGETLVFNISEYSDRLTRMFLLRGGRMVRRAFPDRQAVLGLSEQVIVNCMGFGAKAIWGDTQMVPVRGQISWLVPQPQARYALYYDHVQAVSRRDGVIVQYVGPNDDWGYGLEDEAADPVETALALGRMRGIFGS
jgi:glycine/D-amino acid oxidase-like deaminating enzyme